MARGFGSAQPDPQTKKKQLEFSAWIEVDLDALQHNLELIQGSTSAQVLPILKGDAYGHGAPVVAAFLKSCGQHAFGVSTVDEALEILGWTRGKLFILSPPLPEQLPQVVKENLTVAVTTPQGALELNRAARALGRPVEVQIKVDTGFGRLGSSPQDFPSLVDTVLGASHLRLTGVFTHFPSAAKDWKFTKDQLRRFLALRRFAPEGLTWHAANSAALLNLPQSHLDLVRVGTLLYGQSPLPLGSEWNLAETWRFKTRIIQTKLLPKGHSVGYGRAFRTTKPTWVGVIPVGYGHGLEVEPQTTPLRQLKQAVVKTFSTHHAVFHEGKPLPILGRIGMGLSCLDLDKTGLQVGDEVSVAMRRTTASKQVPRLYFRGGALKCIFWNNQLFSASGRPLSVKGLF